MDALRRSTPQERTHCVAMYKCAFTVFAPVIISAYGFEAKHWGYSDLWLSTIFVTGNEIMTTSRLDKLKQQREKLELKIAAEQKRVNAKTRKDDTRRKILDGALIQNEAKVNPDIARILNKLRQEKLIKAQDRMLFDLEPLETAQKTDE